MKCNLLNKMKCSEIELITTFVIKELCQWETLKPMNKGAIIKAGYNDSCLLLWMSTIDGINFQSLLKSSRSQLMRSHVGFSSMNEQLPMKKTFHQVWGVAQRARAEALASKRSRNPSAIHRKGRLGQLRGHGHGQGLPCGIRSSHPQRAITVAGAAVSNGRREHSRSSSDKNEGLSQRQRETVKQNGENIKW